MFAGLGSGKSQAATYRLVNLMYADYGISVSHFFPSYKLAKRRGFYGVQNYLKLIGVEFTVNKADMTVYVPECDGTFYLETYHDPDAIVSFEVAHAVVDELDTLEKEKARHVWTKISERVRQQCRHPIGNTVGCATTPDHGVNGFCYELWGSGENIDQGYHYIRAGTRGNMFLPSGYADQIAQNYDAVMCEAYLDGGWVSFTRNKVYHQFNRITHHTDRVLLEDERIYVGLDFNVGGTCAVVFVIDNNKPIAVDEFVSRDTQDFIFKMQKYSKHRATIFPDASGRSDHTNSSISDISLIRGAGYSVDAPLANAHVRDRINAVNGLLSHGRMQVNTSKCPELTNALEVRGYTDRGDPEKFNSHPAIDDWADSCEYFINRKYPIEKRTTSINELRI